MKYRNKNIFKYIWVFVLLGLLCGTETRAGTTTALAGSTLNICSCGGEQIEIQFDPGMEPNLTLTTMYYLVDGSGTIVAMNTTGVFPGASLTNGSYTVYVVNYDTASPAATDVASLTVNSIYATPNNDCSDEASIGASVTDACCICPPSILNVCDCNLTSTDLIVNVQGDYTSDPNYTTIVYLVDPVSGNIIASGTPGALLNVTMTGTFDVYVVNYDMTDAIASGAVSGLTVGQPWVDPTGMGCLDVEALPGGASFNDPVSCPCTCPPSILNVCDCSLTSTDLTVNVLGDYTSDPNYTTVVYLVDPVSGNIIASGAPGALLNVTMTGTFDVYVVNYDMTDAIASGTVSGLTVGQPWVDPTGMGCLDVEALPGGASFNPPVTCPCTVACPTVSPQDATPTVCDGGLGTELGDWQMAVTAANASTPATDPDGTSTGVVYSSVQIGGGVTVPDGDVSGITGVHSGTDNCTPETQVVYAYLGCDSTVPADATTDSYQLAGTFTLTLYPDITNQVNVVNNDNGCCPTLTLECAGYTATYDYNGGGTGNPDCSAENGTGNFTFTVTLDNAPAGLGAACVTNTYPAAYNCTVACPTVAITDNSPTICDGGLGTELGDWQTAVIGVNPATDPDGTSTGIVYSSTDLGTTTTTTPDGDVSGITGVHSGADNCTPEPQIVYAYLGCDNTGDGVADAYQLAGTLTLTVYPDIANQGHMLNGDGVCGPSITLNCPGYTVTNDFDGNGANPSFTTGSGSVNFTIALDPAVAALAGTGCEDFDIPATYNCTAPDVSVDKNDADNGDDTQTVAIGGTATFTITVTNTGSEDLCDVMVTDPNGASCVMTYTANGGTLVVGDSWTYTCTVTNVTDDFTNTAFVTAEGCTSGIDVDDDDPTEVVVTCLADAGLLSVDFTCPGDETMCTVTAYTDDTGFETWIVITDVSGTILDVLGPVDANGQVMIPYSYWQGLGVGQDYFIYAYNFDTTNPPTTIPTPAAVIGQNVNVLANPFDGCSDITTVGSPLFVPAPLITDCNNQMDEGNQGGITPVYYNEHEMCIKGGTPPYSFNWCTQGYVRHATSGTISYGNGVYGMEMNVIYSDNAVWAVTITDAEGCTVDDWKFTNDPVVEAWQQTNQAIAPGSTGSVLDVFHSNIIPAGDCYDLNDGSIEVCVEGGYSGEYTYNWTGPFTWTDGPMLNVDPMNNPSTVPGTNNVAIQNANDYFGGVAPVTDPSHCYPGTGMPAVGTMNCFTLSGLTQGWYTLTVTDQGTGTTGNGPNPNTSPGSSDIQETIQWFWVHCNFPYTNPDGTGGGGRGKIVNLQEGIGIAAYPNPFSEKTTLEFGINESENVEIGLYGVDGKRMGQLFNGQAKAGQVYQLPFEANRLPSGVYIVKLTTKSGKMKHAKLFVSP